MSDAASHRSGDLPIGIRLLGAPAIEASGAGRVFPQKGYQLLALLVLSPGLRSPRRNAAEMLWETEDGEVPFDNLRQLLARVKPALAGSGAVLRADRQDIWLEDPDRRIDLARFVAGDESQMHALYRGQLLDGMETVTDRYHDWLLVERMRLEDRYFEAMRKRLREMTRHGAADKAELDALGVALLRIDPNRDASYRALIEAHVRANFLDDAARLEAMRAAVAARAGTAGAIADPPGAGDRPHDRRPAASVRPRDADPGQGGRTATVPRVSFLKPRWMMPDKREETLLDMLIEDVANELSRFRTFTMLAPHSTYQLDGEPGPPLGECPYRSDYRISGLVKPERRLSLRLTEVSSGEIVWAGEFSIAREALLSSFSTLCRLIAQELSAGIERELARTFAKPATSGAYGSYLLGQSAMKACRLPHLRRARKHFRAAGAEAPGFAPAQARLAQTLYQEWLVLGAADPERLNEANHCAKRAVDVDANDGLSQWINGVIALYRREFDRSEAHFEIAETLAPNSADLLVQYGDALAHLARPAEGMGKFERALELNPSPPEHYWWVGAGIAFSLEDYALSIRYCGRIRDDESVVRILAAAHALNGDLREARHYGRKVRELYPGAGPDDLVRVVPDRDPGVLQRFRDGLRMAGI